MLTGLLAGLAFVGLSACPKPQPAASLAPAPLSSGAPMLPPDATIDRHEDESVRRIAGLALDAALTVDPEYSRLIDARDFAGRAQLFVTRFAGEFRLADPAHELAIARVQDDSLGYHIVRFRQAVGGLGVPGAELSVHFDPKDQLYLVAGDYLPTPLTLRLTPTLSASEAARAVPDVQAASPAASPELLVWRDATRTPHLVYRVSAGTGLADQAEVLVDAHSGDVLRRTSTVYH